MKLRLVQSLTSDTRKLTVFLALQIADLKNQMQRSSGASAHALEESRRFKLELDSVGGKISSLEANNAAHMVSSVLNLELPSII